MTGTPHIQSALTSCQEAASGVPVLRKLHRNRSLIPFLQTEPEELHLHRPPLPHHRPGHIDYPLLPTSHVRRSRTGRRPQTPLQKNATGVIAQPRHTLTTKRHTLWRAQKERLRVRAGIARAGQRGMGARAYMRQEYGAWRQTEEAAAKR